LTLLSTGRVTTDGIAGAHPHVRSRTLVAMTFARLIFF